MAPKRRSVDGVKQGLHWIEYARKANPGASRTRPSNPLRATEAVSQTIVPEDFRATVRPEVWQRFYSSFGETLLLNKLQTEKDLQEAAMAIDNATSDGNAYYGDVFEGGGYIPPPPSDDEL
jgi:hypothetical protein